jgi:hypothetical protein
MKNNLSGRRWRPEGLLKGEYYGKEILGRLH